jgi:hypothetical protein
MPLIPHCRIPSSAHLCICSLLSDVYSRSRSGQFKVIKIHKRQPGLSYFVRKFLLFYLHCRSGAQASKGKANPLQAFKDSRKSRLPELLDNQHMIAAHKRYPWYSGTQGHNAAGRIKSMKNLNGPIGNRTRDLPTYSAVPLAIAPGRVLLRPSRTPNCISSTGHTLHIQSQ